METPDLRMFSGCSKARESVFKSCLNPVTGPFETARPSGPEKGLKLGGFDWLELPVDFLGLLPDNNPSFNSL
jgi:hypothetical protein